MSVFQKDIFGIDIMCFGKQNLIDRVQERI